MAYCSASTGKSQGDADPQGILIFTCVQDAEKLIMGLKDALKQRSCEPLTLYVKALQGLGMLDMSVVLWIKGSVSTEWFSGFRRGREPKLDRSGEGRQ